MQVAARWPKQIANPKEICGNLKKVLDKWLRWCYYIEAVRESGAKQNNGSKKFEKTWKKYLTNETEHVRISKLTARAASESVPCKLNNVKTNYNTLDILKCLSLKSCKRILSQRKFLSIFARQIYSKNDLSCESSLDTIFWEFDPGSGRTLAACLTHASRTG